MTAPGPDSWDQEPAGPPAWRRVAAEFVASVASGRLDLPFPGSGRTTERWAAFADLAGQDLSVARLSEGHADALAILAELGGPRPPAGSRWGVWAAHPPGPALEAVQADGGWLLAGWQPAGRALAASGGRLPPWR